MPKLVRGRKCWRIACSKRDVRIALRSTTAAVTNPLLKETPPTGVSFLAVLAKTAGLPSQEADAGDARPDAQDDSDAASHRQQPASSDPGATIRPQSQNQRQNLVAPFTDVAGANLTVVPVTRFQAALSTASSTVRPPAKDQTEEAASSAATKTIASTAANTVALPLQLVQSVPVPHPADASRGPAVNTSVTGGQKSRVVDASSTDSRLTSADSAVTSRTSEAPLVVASSPLPTVQRNPEAARVNGDAEAEIQPARTQPISDLPVPATTSNADQPESGAPRLTAPPVTGIDSHATRIELTNQTENHMQAATATTRPEADHGGQAANSSGQTVGDSTAPAQTGDSRSTQSSIVAAALATGALPPPINLLSSLNVPAILADATQTLGKPAEVRINDVAGAKNPAAVSETESASQSGSAKGNSVAGSSAAPAGSLASNILASATPQHPQTDASPATAAVVKPSEAAAMKPVPVHSAPSQASVETASKGMQNLASPATLTPAEGGDPLPASGVNTAKLIQTLSETQMQVGMRSTEFGDISIRTSVSQQQILAQITVDHGDLGRALALHAPAAQSKLGDDLGLHASIEVTQSNSSLSGERGATPQQQQRSFVPAMEVDGSVTSPDADAAALRPASDNADRLDIRA